MTTKSNEPEEEQTWSEAYQGAVQPPTGSAGTQFLAWILIPVVVAILVIIYVFIFDPVTGINTILLLGSMILIVISNGIAALKGRMK